jgi:hypothetical protein
MRDVLLKIVEVARDADFARRPADDRRLDRSVELILEAIARVIDVVDDLPHVTIGQTLAGLRGGQRGAGQDYEQRERGRERMAAAHGILTRLAGVSFP